MIRWARTRDSTADSTHPDGPLAVLLHVRFVSCLLGSLQVGGGTLTTGAALCQLLHLQVGGSSFEDKPTRRGGMIPDVREMQC
jgi:hypothetical protein